MVGRCNIVGCEHPKTSFSTSCGTHYNEWVANQPTYKGIHTKLKLIRGPASDHECINCDKLAQDWAYIHGDVNEKYHTTNAGSRLAYSLKLSYYMPLCHKCHMNFDRN